MESLCYVLFIAQQPLKCLDSVPRMEMELEYSEPRQMHCYAFCQTLLLWLMLTCHNLTSPNV